MVNDERKEVVVVEEVLRMLDRKLDINDPDDFFRGNLLPPPLPPPLQSCCICIVRPWVGEGVRDEVVAAVV